MCFRRCATLLLANVVVNVCPDSSISSADLRFRNEKSHLLLSIKNRFACVFNYRIPGEIYITHDPEVRSTSQKMCFYSWGVNHQLPMYYTAHCFMGGVIIDMQVIITREINILHIYFINLRNQLHLHRKQPFAVTLFICKFLIPLICK